MFDLSIDAKFVSISIDNKHVTTSAKYWEFSTSLANMNRAVLNLEHKILAVFMIVLKLYPQHEI